MITINTWWRSIRWRWWSIRWGRWWTIWWCYKRKKRSLSLNVIMKCYNHKILATFHFCKTRNSTEDPFYQKWKQVVCGNLHLHLLCIISLFKIDLNKEVNCYLVVHSCLMELAQIDGTEQLVILVLCDRV